MAMADDSSISSADHDLAGFGSTSWEKLPNKILSGQLLDLNKNHPLEDSGYESHASKEETQTSPDTTDLSTSTMSAPKPSRIPILSESVTTLRPRRSDQPLKIIHSQRILQRSQSQIPCEQNLSEEAFLRQIQGQSSTTVKPGVFPVSPHLRKACHSRSVPIRRTPTPTRLEETKDSNQQGLALPPGPPKFNIRPMTPGLVSSGHFPVTSPLQLPSMTTMLKGSESFKKIQTMVDETVNEILDSGEMEFSGKYSTWIQQVFNLHLEKVHSRLKAAYSEKLSESLQAKKEEVIQIKTAYRAKLLEFESATKKFQSWYDDVLEENRVQAAANERMMVQLMEKESSLSTQHETELKSRLIQMEGQAEAERSRDLERHAEEIKTVTERGLEQNRLLTAQYQRQIVMLKAQLKSALVMNMALKKKFAECRSREVELRACSGGDEVTNVPGDNEGLTDLELREVNGCIDDLERKLAELEARNKAMTTAHTEELAKLHQTLDTNNQKLRKLIKETRISALNSRKDRERGVHEMEQAIVEKEAEYKRKLSALTAIYGDKIEALTTSVQALQNQLG